VRHAETGITIHPGSADSCAWGIIHTLEHPDWALQRATNAYREALVTYSWDTIAAQTVGVYDRVVRERAATIW
jgi:glycosyltransferase involved in cell wall biosynthesis